MLRSQERENSTYLQVCGIVEGIIEARKSRLWMSILSSIMVDDSVQNRAHNLIIIAHSDRA